jgi:hypothetical protein
MRLTIFERKMTAMAWEHSNGLVRVPFGAGFVWGENPGPVVLDEPAGEPPALRQQGLPRKVLGIKVR